MMEETSLEDTLAELNEQRTRELDRAEADHDLLKLTALMVKWSPELELPPELGRVREAGRAVWDWPRR